MDNPVIENSMAGYNNMPQTILNQVPTGIGQMLKKQTATFNLSEYDKEYAEVKYTDEEIPKGSYAFLITKCFITEKIKSGKNKDMPGLNISLKVVDGEYKESKVNKFTVIKMENIPQIKTDIKNCLGHDLRPFSLVGDPAVQKQFVGKTVQADVAYSEFEGKTYQNIYIKHSINILGVTNSIKPEFVVDDLNDGENEFAVPADSPI